MRAIPADAERFYCELCVNCEAWASPTSISLKCGECGSDLRTDDQWEAYWLDVHLAGIDALKPIPWQSRATFAHSFIAALDTLPEANGDHPERIAYDDACRVADAVLFGTRGLVTREGELADAGHRFVRRYLDHAGWNKSLSEWAADWSREEVEALVG